MTLAWWAYAAVELAAGASSNAAHVPTEAAGAVMDASIYAEGGLLEGRLRGAGDLGLRTWTDAERPALRLSGTGAYEEPAGDFAFGIGVGVSYEDEPVVFTLLADGSTPDAEALGALSAKGVRAEPFAAWIGGPLRLEVSALAGRRVVAGAEDYAYGDAGGRASARLLAGRLAVRLHGLIVRRAFDALPAVALGGDPVAAAGPVQLGMLEAGVGVAWYGDALEARASYEARRTYDLVTSWFSGWRHVTEAGLTWRRGRFETDGALWFLYRDFGARDPLTPGATLAEAGLGVRVGAGFALRRWFEPRLRYERNRASALVDRRRAVLFEEHLVMMGLRSRL